MMTDAAPADPFVRLRAEHDEMMAAARRVEGALSRRRLTDDDRSGLEESMRLLRALLPRHLVLEERFLYPELERVEPAAAPLVRDLCRRHLGLEQAFGTLQGLALARSVNPDGGRAQRTAALAARVFRTQLEALVRLKEVGPFPLAARALGPEPLKALADALAAPPVLSVGARGALE